ncbi:oxidase [Roseovarius spongiae]|nr:oxidase [Roseovarius spongiae]
MAFISDMMRVLTRDSIRRAVLVCCVPALVFYLLALLILTQAGFTLVEILRDTAQTTGESSFLGFVSSFGAWLWVAAASVAAFRVVVEGRGATGAHRRLALLLAGFSFFLALDDFFMIHDRFLTEGILIPLYILFLYYLIRRFWPLIARVDGTAFLMAGGFLAMSVIVDAVQEILPISYGASQALEEGFKFLGGAGWLYFCTRVAAHRLVVAPVEEG